MVWYGLRFGTLYGLVLFIFVYGLVLVIVLYGLWFGTVYGMVQFSMVYLQIPLNKKNPNTVLALIIGGEDV